MHCTYTERTLRVHGACTEVHARRPIVVTTSFSDTDPSPRYQLAFAGSAQTASKPLAPNTPNLTRFAEIARRNLNYRRRFDASVQIGQLTAIRGGHESMAPIRCLTDVATVGARRTNVTRLTGAARHRPPYKRRHSA